MKSFRIYLGANLVFFLLNSAFTQSQAFNSTTPPPVAATAAPPLTDLPKINLTGINITSLANAVVDTINNITNSSNTNTSFPRNIIVFKNKPTQELIKRLGTKVEEFIQRFFFTSGYYSPEIIKFLNQSDLVEFIEPDYKVKAAQLPGNISLVSQEASRALWGLDRIDQRGLPLDGKFRYPSSAGAGVTVYIIDTGVDVTSDEFEGRASFGYNSLQDQSDVRIDDNGHGTFAAGIIAGKTVGVAKKAKIVAVKSLGADGSALVSDVLRGLNWVVRQHLNSQDKRSIINLSLGSPFSRATNNAVNNAVAQGVTVVVAAGNGDDNGVAEDACDFSPSSASSVITVGASDINDKIGSFSNYGKCVTLIAPGIRVTSIGDGGESNSGVLPGYGSASGTSFAGPFVTGAVALLLGEGGYIVPSEIKKRLIDVAGTGLLSGAKSGTPNRLLNSFDLNFGPGSSSNDAKRHVFSQAITLVILATLMTTMA